MTKFRAHSRRLTAKALASMALVAGMLLGSAASVQQSSSNRQRYLVEVWQMEHGLPENIVNAIAQTPDGYLWCGTTHGLARFDGARFKVFNARNTPELGSGRIRQLFVDRAGALWISIFEGRIVRYFEGRFTPYFPPPRESTARTTIRFAQDLSGALWLTVEDGAIFRFADGKFTLTSKDWTPAGRIVFQVYDDGHGQPWVATATNVARLKQDKLFPVLSGKSGQYEFLCPSRSGGAWIQTAGRVGLWREGQWEADAGPWVPPERRVEYCLEDRGGHIWVASLGRGIFCYATNAPVRQITVKDGLGSDLVRALFEDSEGNLWAGTRAGGLNRLRPALFQSYGRQSGLASDLVTAICEAPDGALWVGTDGDGVDRLRDNSVEHFSKEQGLTGGHVRALLWDRQTNFWLGSWPGGLFRLDGDHFTPLRDFPGRDMGLASLLQDSKGRLWIGQRTLNRLVRFEDGAAVTIDLPNPAPALDVTVMAEDASGNLWIGTDGSGLFCWQEGKCRRFSRADGLPSDTIRALHSEPDGSLWIGTVDGGLCRFKNNRFVPCTTRDGLVDDVINYIADDQLGCFWFSSFQGIFRIRKAELNDFADGKRGRIQCVAYGKSDGLPALECPGGFQPAGCRTRDGRLWFPTIKGLVVVDPANVPTTSIPPPVLIEEALADGENQAIDKAMKSPGTSSDGSAHEPGWSRTDRHLALIIPPGKHRYEFRYTGLNFTAPERVRFRHRLHGLEDEWVEAGAQRTASYGYLPPGDYRFEVVACNQAGVWSQSGDALAFRVLPHVWQTWWFTAGWLTTAAAALGGAVFYAVRRKYSRRLQRVEMQLSVERERARIAQDIHDGVGANLTEIAWLAEVAEHEALNPDEVRTHTRKISGTARETVAAFDEIVWAILPQNDTLAGFVEYLGRRVDELSENTTLRYWYSAPKELPHIVVAAEVRHSFFLACQEALHNVSKHANATEVRVQVTLENRSLHVDIQDNGCGFDPAATRPAGNGLRNMRRRFDALGGQFELRTRPGQGTTVSMSIPLTPSGRN